MERYQVLLNPDQKERVRRIAEQQRRSAASVLRQALDLGLDMLEGKNDIWEQRRKILEKARQRLENQPVIELDLVHANRQERDDEMDRVWQL